MSEFKKVPSKNELYVGFVDNQDKYDKFGFCRNTSYEYFGQYNCGIRDGYGAIRERGSEGSVVIGEIFNDSINGIGIQFKRGVVYFGYFYNGIFESGFTIGRELSFVSKKHNKYELCLGHNSEDNYKFKLVKYNNTESEEEETKSFELSHGFNGNVESLKNKFNVMTFAISDSQIVINDDFYGSLYPSLFGLELDENSWNIHVYDNKIEKTDDYIRFLFGSISLIYSGKVVILRYDNSFELEIKEDLFIIKTLGRNEYELEIDADFNINYYARHNGIRINKLDNFSFEIDDTVKYEYNENIDEELNKLIGLTKAKEQLQRIIGYVVKNKDKKPNIHMAFLGNPGTGKTTFAKLIADLFYKYNVLPTNKFINGNRSTLVARYIGHTAPKTRKAVNDAMGGVLLIDEAYALADKGEKKSFGSEAIDILIQEMENKRGEFCCILAGYKREMLELFNTNPGFKSRIPFIIDFEDFTTDELEIIVNKLLDENKLKVNDIVKNKIMSILVYMKSNPYFGNARDCRNLIEQLHMIAEDREDFDGEITLDDISIYMKENTLFEKRIGKAPMIDINRINEYMKENPKDNDKPLLTLNESFIALVNSYNKETIVTSGVIISPDGYALTVNLKPNDCISSDATRYTTDLFGNDIKVYETVYSTNNSDYSVIKLSNDGDKLPYAIIDNITEEDIKRDDLRICGISVNNNDNKKVIKSIDIKLVKDNDKYKIVYPDDNYYLDGAFIYSKSSLKVFGLIKDKNTFIEIKEFYNQILENQVK